eukprot:1967759-Pyramimonas_sp.AAC.2
MRSARGTPSRCRHLPPSQRRPRNHAPHQRVTSLREQGYAVAGGSGRQRPRAGAGQAWAGARSRPRLPSTGPSELLQRPQVAPGPQPHAACRMPPAAPSESAHDQTR